MKSKILEKPRKIQLQFKLTIQNMQVVDFAQIINRLTSQKYIYSPPRQKVYFRFN